MLDDYEVRDTEQEAEEAFWERCRQEHYRRYGNQTCTCGDCEYCDSAKRVGVWRKGHGFDISG